MHRIKYLNYDIASPEVQLAYDKQKYNAGDTLLI